MRKQRPVILKVEFAEWQLSLFLNEAFATSAVCKSMAFPVLCISRALCLFIVLCTRHIQAFGRELRNSGQRSSSGATAPRVTEPPPINNSQPVAATTAAAAAAATASAAVAAATVSASSASTVAAPAVAVAVAAAAAAAAPAPLPAAGWRLHVSRRVLSE